MKMNENVIFLEVCAGGNWIQIVFSLRRTKLEGFRIEKEYFSQAYLQSIYYSAGIHSRCHVHCEWESINMNFIESIPFLLREWESLEFHDHKQAHHILSHSMSF